MMPRGEDAIKDKVQSSVNEKKSLTYETPTIKSGLQRKSVDCIA